MKKTMVIKILSIMAIAVLLISFSTPVFALGVGSSEGKVTADRLNSSISSAKTNATNSVYKISGVIYGVAKAIALSVAVIILVVLAIKYFSASAEGKSEVKKYAVSYIVGALLLFGGTGILTLLENAAKGF